MRKQNKIEGQISFWEIEIPKIVISEKQPEQIKEAVERDITKGQQKIIDKYKLVDELSRIIHYCGGGIGIELISGESFKTIYVNKDGQEEFVMKGESPALPLDEILLTKNEYLQLNDIQKERLKELKEKHGLNSYIKRKGDKNVIVLVNGKAISINSKGWLLEFSKAIYRADEVIVLKKDIVEYDVGDMVEAMWGNEKIVGKIYSKYSDKEAFNIVWDNKHSAFHKSKILSKIA